MNLGMSVRAELFRARRMKLAVIIALMYLGIAGIYVFAGSGAMGLRRGRGPVLWLFRRSGLSFLDRGWANGYLFLAKCRLHGAYGVLPNRLCCCGGDAIR